MSLLPSRGPETSTRQDGDFEVVGVDEDVAPVLDALASDTARDVLNEIYENPGTPSEIANRLDMSIQKVSYHLEKLEEVDLIAVAGTRYSEKGQEMTVYEPPDDPLVLFVGTKERKSRLKSLVKRIVPTIGALAFGSLLMQRLFSRDGSIIPFGSGSGDGETSDVGYSLSGGDDAGDGGNAAGGNGASGNGNGAGGNGNAAGGNGNGADVSAHDATSTPMATDGGVEAEAATETPEAMETAAPTPVEQATEVAQETPTADTLSTSADVATEEGVRVTVESAGAGIEPGLAFFLGGVFALTVVGLWWYYRNRPR